MLNCRGSIYRGVVQTIQKEIKEVMIRTDGVKWKLDEVVESVQPHEGREVLDGEVDEEWDKNDNKNVADSDDTYILVKWGVITKCYRGCNMRLPYN